MKILNYTPHTVCIIGDSGTTEFKSCGVARVNVEQSQIGDINSIPLYKSSFGEVVGLPSPEDGTLYIVSAMVLNATDRTDVIAPNTSKAIRDESGKIIGVNSFVTK